MMGEKNMDIKKVVVGRLEENCYILSIDDECLVVDPGDEFEKIKATINNKKVLGILITHHHFDHVGALEEMLDYYKTRVYDYKTLKEKEYQIGPFTFEVIYNPGHTEDSISFYFKEHKIMFVGDFIFLESIGRCDLEDSSFIKMRESINKLIQINDNITLYPGHGVKTTLDYEKRYNSFF